MEEDWWVTCWRRRRRRRRRGGGGDGGGLVAHLLEEEGRGAEEGARRGEKEGLAGAESLISKQNTFEIERPKGILATPKR